jgi:RNA polymerase sigma-70 factor, ECF subfamily
VVSAGEAADCNLVEQDVKLHAVQLQPDINDDKNMNNLTDGTDDQALIARLIAGDEKAFCALIKRYHHLMLAIARAIVGDAFADDAVQDAWLAVHRNIGKFEGRSSLKTWIMTIASNEAKGRLRREARKVSLDELDGEAPGSYLDSNMFDENRHWVSPIPVWRSDAPDALIEEKQLQECINKTLELLPPAQKAAFILRELEEQPFETICDILQVSSANVRVLLHRARLTLMQMIDRYQETGSCC